MALIARYDLRRHQPCFDFFTWLVDVKARGAIAIVLQTNNLSKSVKSWGTDYVRERVESILKPGAALAGLPWREGFDGEDIGSSALKDFVAHYAPGYDFPRLTSVLPPEKHRYTVTLRRSIQKGWRNSNEKLWRKFAAEIGALVIEDYSVMAMPLHKRMAIYAGAEMNFFVANGPALLCFFTDYPMTVFGCNNDPAGWERTGIPKGTQVPWFRKNQTLVWEAPTLLGLHRHLEQMIP